MKFPKNKAHCFLALIQNADFDEAKHPRDDDGKFGKGHSGGKQKKEPKKKNSFQIQYEKDLDAARKQSRYKTEKDVQKAFERGEKMYHYSGIMPDDLTPAQLYERMLSKHPSQRPPEKKMGPTPQASWKDVVIRPPTI